MAAMLVSHWTVRLARNFVPSHSNQKFLLMNLSHGTDLPVKESHETVTISDSCISRLQELGPNTRLRVGVEGGGCSGFQYTFELDSAVEEGDQVFSRNGVSVVVDETSLQFLKGATIEYHAELIRSAFRVVNNPLAEQGCSCGASFNIKVN